MRANWLIPAMILGALAVSGCKKPEPADANPVPDPFAGSPGPEPQDPAPAGASCVMLGWGGGAAGSGYKMVRSSIEVADGGARLNIKYNWKGGTMTLHRNPGNPNSYSGTWQQQGSNGSGNLNFSEPYTKATGSWSSPGGKQNAMTISPCG
ncbi:MAG: hypothetical protein MUF64_00380 [Polyangiaceae bacterium]|jgi:hypothetical protein|nr:hypothetical protein [Polyangiaceae bacterium]